MFTFCRGPLISRICVLEGEFMMQSLKLMIYIIQVVTDNFTRDFRKERPPLIPKKAKKLRARIYIALCRMPMIGQSAVVLPILHENRLQFSVQVKSVQSKLPPDA